MIEINKSVCVLGGGGSIGSRLVHQLVSNGYSVTVVVRRLQSAVRIGRLKVNIVVMDLLDEPQGNLDKLFHGIDYVIDCSFQTGADTKKVIQQSKEVAQKVLMAANLAGVNRIVHYGTISVYPKDGVTINEQTQCDYSGESYADGKLAAERTFLKADNVTPVTVLQLPIVFGPFMNWTVSIANDMSSSKLIIPDSFYGVCSAVYVDDVVRVSEQALSQEVADNQKLLINGINLSWTNFYQEMAQLSDSFSMEIVTRLEYEQAVKELERNQSPFSRLRTKFAQDGDFRQLVLAQFGFRHVYRLVKQIKGQPGIDKIKTSIADDPDVSRENGNLLPKDRADLFDALPQIDSSLASDTLNFKASNFHQCMQETREWLMWAGYVNH